MPFPKSIQEFWDEAVRRGFFPLAIARGSKAPIGEGWSTWTHPIPHPGAGSVGLRCGDGGLSGFDVDCSQPEISARLLAAFRNVLGTTIPVRWGRKPRFLIPYFLTDAPVQGRTFTFATSGEKLQLMGGQFIAFGPHKDTGQPYEWENWESEWPRITTAQLQYILAEVPMRAGTSLRFSAEHETCTAEEIADATPRTQDEWQAGRDAAQRYLGMLKQELLGRTEGRGSTIFALVGVLKFAAMHSMCTREEIEDAIIGAGHSLTEGIGGRTLGEEVNRHDELPVLRGNLIMLAVLNRRILKHALFDAMQAPTLIARTGFEVSLDDKSDELPWLLHQRVLCGEVHLFTGHSGAGKSTVVTDLAISMLCGRAWLDADIERADGHVLWIAAEDAYGTERRVRHMLRQEPNGAALAARFHVVPGVSEPMAFEQQYVAQVQAMAAMKMRVDLGVVDTWGASGLCFADNDTEAVLKAMFILKLAAKRTETALIVTDHLPMGNSDAWQKGNGAKTGNSGFVYRITAGRQDLISIDCGKARGCPKPKSYIGRIASENYGVDSKGRPTTVNIFRRDDTPSTQEREISAALKLAGMLPGVVATGMDALRAGSIVKFESVAELGDKLADDEAPGFVVNKDAALKMFAKEGLEGLMNSGYLRTMRGAPFFAIYSPMNGVKHALTMPWPIEVPTQPGGFPW